jgi:hypothetical protein
MRLEDRRLTLEAKDRAVNERDVVPDGGVVDEVARGKVSAPSTITSQPSARIRSMFSEVSSSL